MLWASMRPVPATFISVMSKRPAASFKLSNAGVEVVRLESGEVVALVAVPDETVVVLFEAQDRPPVGGPPSRCLWFGYARCWASQAS
jgi:hypothetical protein